MPSLQRLKDRIVAFFPAGAAGWVLAGLLVAGITLRIVAIASYWPATTTRSDAIPTPRRRRTTSARREP